MLAASYSSHCSRSVKVKSDKSLSSNLRELEMNSWNSVVSGPVGEEWGEFRKPGEPGERDDLEEHGVKGEDWDEAELKLRSLIVAPQVPDVTSSVFSCRGDKCPGKRWLSSASCSASLIIEWIWTNVFAKVLEGFLHICCSGSSSSSTNIGEIALSAILPSRVAVRRGPEWGPRDSGCGDPSQDGALGDGEPSDSWSNSTKRRLSEIRKNEKVR